MIDFLLLVVARCGRRRVAAAASIQPRFLLVLDVVWLRHIQSFVAAEDDRMQQFGVVFVVRVLSQAADKGANEYRQCCTNQTVVHETNRVERLQCGTVKERTKSKDYSPGTFRTCSNVDLPFVGNSRGWIHKGLIVTIDWSVAQQPGQLIHSATWLGNRSREGKVRAALKEDSL